MCVHDSMGFISKQWQSLPREVSSLPASSLSAIEAIVNSSSCSFSVNGVHRSIKPALPFPLKSVILLMFDSFVEIRTNGLFWKNQNTLTIFLLFVFSKIKVSRPTAKSYFPSVTPFSISRPNSKGFIVTSKSSLL